MRCLVVIPLLLSGCATVDDPHVWAPLAAAALLQINDADERLSSRLYETSPLFGDVERAKDWSDNFRTYTEAAYLMAGAAVDLPADQKAFLLTTEYLSVEAVDEVRRGVWRQVDRERPDGSGNNSMPSGHALTASYQASLAKTNTELSALPHKRYLDLAYTSFAALTAYARVEAGRHYPSDVLVGYALGSFFGNITRELAHLSLGVTPNSLTVSAAYTF